MPDKIAALQLERLPLPLNEHQSNPRIHPEPGSEEWELLRASLVDAYFDPLVWNICNEKLVSGHLRQKVMLAEGFTHADCVVVDWPEEQHLARMIAANRGMGEDDYDSLKILLEDLEERGFDLKLAGLSEIEVERIQMIYDEEGENDPAKEWKGMPACDQQDLSAWKSVRVNFANAADLEAFAALVGQTLTEKTRSIWFPKAEIGTIADKRWVSES